MSSRPIRSSAGRAPSWSVSKRRCSTASAAALLALALASGGAALAQDDITGRWQTVDDETGRVKSIVEIYPQGQRLFGRIVKLFPADGEDPDPVCKKCSGPQHNQKIVGLEILKNLRWDGDSWTKGTILDPAKGKVYDTKLWLENGELKVRGYLGIFFRTQVWRRDG